MRWPSPQAVSADFAIDTPLEDEIKAM